MSETENQQNSEQWERDLLSRLAFASLNEQRRARKWSTFFKLLLVGYIIVLTVLVAYPDISKVFSGEQSELFAEEAGHTALVELSGIISSDMEANADNIIRGLRKAFKHENTKGVILRINSPGGSPVQSGYINDEIMRLREEYPEMPFYVVITDICASGGYYIAAAGQEIYADKASVVGSIGVIMTGGFGFVNAIEKLGIERRVYAAGDNKAFLDPFSPEKEADVQHITNLLSNVHQQFIDVVKAGRGDRLNGEDEKLFSGLVWTGEQAVELGLIDGLGNTSYVAREKIGAEDIRDFTPRPDYLDRFTEQLGVSIASKLSKQLNLEQGLELQ
ncbi:S49 family peptidase [Candidatus Albibeggiatoa sp. nov. NOAA]|uniref:S49 family peptidase n=1 Tax=Candidatus Albibeggiatoa sp. nov. NOAA TaxID=3162724 RepID=UPI0033019C04|nr:S49 family peptidase [Thiotrichaceae bacterium]